jgi:hypothetical protein
MLELDLMGRRIALDDSDVAVLLVAAERASGSSVGSRDLATRLKDMAAPSAQGRRRRLVFSRPESRALQRLLQTDVEPDARFHELDSTLSELLAPDPAATDGR